MSDDLRIRTAVLREKLLHRAQNDVRIYWGICAMADADAESDKQQLKDAVRSIILVQGNEFIKELLRKHKLQIGTKKADFSKNILAAIDAGTLTRPMIEDWLSEVEGWGNQHIISSSHPRCLRRKSGGSSRNLISPSSSTRLSATSSPRTSNLALFR